MNYNSPCKNCLVFPICKNKLFERYPHIRLKTPSFNKNLLWYLASRCAPLYRYAYAKIPLSLCKKREDHIAKLFEFSKVGGPRYV
jgi:hypothetical protein